VYKPWTKVSVNRKSGTDGSIPISITVDVPYDAYLQFTDTEWRLEKWTVTIDSNSAQTSGYSPEPNKQIWCASSGKLDGDTCISNGFSNGKWPLSSGQHVITFEAKTYDPASDYKYFVGLYEIYEKCD